MFPKVLVANRGEIAVRAFRAATSSAPARSRSSPTRTAGPSTGSRPTRPTRSASAGHPVRAYLDPEAIVAVAVEARRGRDLPRLRLPLGEPRTSPRRARTPASPSSGPPAAVLHLTGNKARAIAAARDGRAADAARRPSRRTDVDALEAAAEEHRLPGVRQGGRRRRRPRHAPGRRPRRSCARPLEACHARGRGAPSATRRVFIEQAVVDPRHIEVQILADGDGQRRSTSSSATARCSAATRRSSRSPRRPTSTPTLRERMCADAVRVRRARSATQRRHGRVPARRGRPLRLHRDEPADPGRAHGHRGGHRRRPRRHRRCGSRRARPSPTSAWPRTTSALRGAALQCRITTEDPANGFRPDTGTITAYRSAGGGGVRLDGGTVFVGAEVSAALRLDAGQAHLSRPDLPDRRRGVPSARSRSSASAACRPTSPSSRPCSPTRTSRTAGRRRRSSTSGPSCSRPASAPTARTKLLTYLADVTVNQPNGPATDAGPTRAPSSPTLDRARPVPPGARDRLLARSAPPASRGPCARQNDVAVTDTTFRDAHQSLLATRVRTRDLMHVAQHVART